MAQELTPDQVHIINVTDIMRHELEERATKRLLPLTSVKLPHDPDTHIELRLHLVADDELGCWRWSWSLMHTNDEEGMVYADGYTGTLREALEDADAIPLTRFDNEQEQAQVAAIKGRLGLGGIAWSSHYL